MSTYPTLDKLTVNGTAVFLEELGVNAGKITVSGFGDRAYASYWGAMGGTLREFLCRINSDYFATNLLGARDQKVVDVRATFTELRRFIRQDLGLKWYEHTEFQKDMREKLREFQTECADRGDAHVFVDRFRPGFIDRLSYYQVDGRTDQAVVEHMFREISEPWGFLQYTPSAEYRWLQAFHAELVKALRTETQKAA